VAVANTSEKLIQNTKLVLVSPIYNVFKYFARQADQLRLHPNLKNQYLLQFERCCLKNFEKLELASTLKPYADNCLIVHDKTDKESNVLSSMKFCSVNNSAQLHVTKGFGHDRLLNSESVWQQLKRHLDYQDLPLS